MTSEPNFSTTYFIFAATDTLFLFRAPSKRFPTAEKPPLAPPMSSPFQRLLADALLAARAAAIRAGTFAGAAAGQLSREALPRMRAHAEHMREQAQHASKRTAAAVESLLQKPPREAAASVYAAAKAKIMTSPKWRIFFSLATVCVIGAGVANGARRAYDSQTDDSEKARLRALLGAGEGTTNDREQAIFDRLLEIKVSNPPPSNEQLRLSSALFEEAALRGSFGYGPASTPPLSEGGLDLLAPPPSVHPTVAAAARRPLVYPSAVPIAEQMAAAANEETNAERVRLGLPPLPRSAIYIPAEAYYGPDGGIAAAAAADPTNPHAWVAGAGSGAAAAAAAKAQAQARAEAEGEDTFFRKAARVGGALLAGVPGLSSLGLFNSSANDGADAHSPGGGVGAGPTADAFFGYGYTGGSSALPRPQATGGTTGAPFGNPLSASAADTRAADARAAAAGKGHGDGPYAYGHSSLAGELYPGHSRTLGADPAQYGSQHRPSASAVAGLDRSDSDSFAHFPPTPAESAFAEQRARMRALRRGRRLATEAAALQRDPTADKARVEAVTEAATAALKAATSPPSPAAVSAELASQRQANRSQDVLPQRAYGPPGYGVALAESALADEKAREAAAKAARSEIRAGGGKPGVVPIQSLTDTKLALMRLDEADGRYKNATEAAAAAAMRGNATEAALRAAPVAVSGGYSAPFRGGGSVAPAQRLGTWGIGEGSSAGVGADGQGSVLHQVQTEQAIAAVAARRRAHQAGLPPPHLGYGNSGNYGAGTGTGSSSNPNGASGAGVNMDDALSGVEGEGEFDGSGRWGARPFRSYGGSAGGGGAGYEADARAGVSAWEGETDRVPNGPARITTKVGGMR